MNYVEYSPAVPAYGAQRILISALARRTSIVDEVRKRIAARPGRIPNLEQVAEDLGISPRTLRRRLTSEGSHFQKVLDQVRLELAREYLAADTMPIGTVAELLGFNNQANFGNAFKRWSGMTPSAYRASRSRTGSEKIVHQVFNQRRTGPGQWYDHQV